MVQIGLWCVKRRLPAFARIFILQLPLPNQPMKQVFGETLTCAAECQWDEHTAYGIAQRDDQCIAASSSDVFETVSNRIPSCMSSSITTVGLRYARDHNTILKSWDKVIAPGKDSSARRAHPPYLYDDHTYRKQTRVFDLREWNYSICTSVWMSPPMSRWNIYVAGRRRSWRSADLSSRLSRRMEPQFFKLWYVTSSLLCNTNYLLWWLFRIYIRWKLPTEAPGPSKTTNG